MMETEKLINGLVEKTEAVVVIKSPYMRAGAWFVFAALYFAIIVAFIGLRDDLAGKLQEAWFASELAIVLIGALFSGLAASYLSVPDSYQREWIKWLAGVPFVVLTAFLLWGLRVSDLSMQLALDVTLAYLCLVDMLVFSIFPIIVMFFFIRKAATTRSLWCSGLASLSAVNFSYFVLRIVEANDAVEHILFWHYGPMLLIVLIGMLVGRRVLSW